MNTKYKIMSSVIKYISVIAKGFAILNVNTTCAGPLHQPKVPDCAKKFQKSHAKYE